MVYYIEIQQLILNTDSCMTRMTFHVQFTKCQPPCQQTLWHVVEQINLKHGTLGAMPLNMEGQGSHLILNVQH